MCDWGLCVRGLGGLVSTCGYVYLCNISKFVYFYGGRVGCRGLFCSLAKLVTRVFQFHLADKYGIRTLQRLLRWDGL